MPRIYIGDVNPALLAQATEEERERMLEENAPQRGASILYDPTGWGRRRVFLQPREPEYDPEEDYYEDRPRRRGGVRFGPSYTVPIGRAEWPAGEWAQEGRRPGPMRRPGPEPMRRPPGAPPGVRAAPGMRRPAEPAPGMRRPPGSPPGVRAPERTPMPTPTFRKPMPAPRKPMRRPPGVSPGAGPSMSVPIAPRGPRVKRLKPRLSSALRLPPGYLPTGAPPPPMSALQVLGVDEIEGLMTQAVLDGDLTLDEAEEGVAGFDIDRSGSVIPTTDTSGKMIDVLFKKKGEGKGAGRKITEALTGWKKVDLAPALQLRVKTGHKVRVTNIGTAAAPIWQVTPITKEITEVEGAEVGFVPFLVPAAAAAGKAVASRVRRSKAARETPWFSDLEPGEEQIVEGAGDVLIDSDGYSEAV